MSVQKFNIQRRGKDKNIDLGITIIWVIVELRILMKSVSSKINSSKKKSEDGDEPQGWRELKMARFDY